MRIVVLNGSPKGETSITMQSVFFIQKQYPQHDLKIINLTNDINEIQRTERRYQEIIDEIEASDGVLWVFPVRVLLVPAQVKRFIELAFEKKSEGAFRGKYAAVIATSYHGADHLALNYMSAVCDDLGMVYAGFYSGELEDLLKENERRRLVLFAESYFEAAASKMPMPRSFVPVAHSGFRYSPSPSVLQKKIDTGGKRVTIITDTNDGQSNAGKMVEAFRGLFLTPPEVVDLSAVEIEWCRGCLHCAYDNSCTHQDADGFHEFFEGTIKSAEMLVYVGTIRDRFLSSRWKLFFDRSFYNNHVPYLTNKQVAFIVSGPLRQLSNVRQYFELYTEWQRANLVDTVTDEDADASAIDGLLRSLAERLVKYADRRYVRTRTFLGIGLDKIIRDIVWGKMRFLAQANHRHFKRNGFYDFPHGDYKTRVINAVMMVLMRVPALRKRLYRSAMRLIIAPHRKLLAKADGRERAVTTPESGP
jgi:multimeric flavodoxin WrbA